MPEDKPLSPTEFAAKIKAKYPQYANIPDEDLAKRIVAIHPEYASKVDFSLSKNSTDSVSLSGSNETDLSRVNRLMTQMLSGQSNLMTPQEKANAEAGGIAGTKAGLETILGMLGGSVIEGAGLKNALLRIAGAGAGAGGANATVQGAATGKVDIGETGTVAATAAAGQGLGEVIGALPSAKRASQMFAEVKGAAGDIPIDVSKPGDIALRTQELAQSGGRMPKVIRDFIARTTKPGAPPLTYSEARDFYNNATRLSADESKTLSPVMKRQIAMFTKELNNSLSGAAGQVGQAQKLESAMNEYHHAMQLKDAGETAKKVFLKVVLPLLIGGGLAGSAFKVAKEATP